MLAAVSDVDLGEASAINDAASRLGGVIAIAAVPALVGATAGKSLSDALGGGYQTAMIVSAGACIVAAGVTARFVSDERATAPAFAPPMHGCVPPDLTGPRLQPLEET